MDNNPTTPGTEIGALDVSTPEGAKTRISDLTHDKEFAARYNSGDRAAKAELDQLQRTAYLGEAPPPPATGPLSPQQAKAQIEQLLHDREWGKRYLAYPQGPEGRELDRLQKIAYVTEGQSNATEATREPGVPAEASSYRFAETPPEGSAELAKSLQSAAHAAEFSQSEFTTIHEQAIRDERANAGRSEAEIIENLDRDLHQIWGKDYERRTALLERYVADYEGSHPGSLAFIRERGLQYNKNLIVSLSQKALRKYGGS